MLEECFGLNINKYAITMQVVYVLSPAARFACWGKSFMVSICALLRWSDIQCIMPSMRCSKVGFFLNCSQRQRISQPGHHVDLAFTRSFSLCLASPALIVRSAIFKKRMHFLARHAAPVHLVRLFGIPTLMVATLAPGRSFE